MIRLVAMIFLLALTSAVPGVNLLALGYLLEVEGRVARGVRRQALFPGFDAAPRVARFILGTSIGLGAVRLSIHVARDAALIDPTRGAVLFVAAYVFAALFAALLVAIVIYRRKEITDLVAELQPHRLFWLGLRGLAVAAIWLALPALLITVSRNVDRGGLLALVGFVLLWPVLIRLPFLQTALAVDGELRAGLAWRTAKDLTRRAPLSFAAALLLSYTLTIPLYLLGVVALPADALWLPALLFVPVVLAARVLIALAYRRAVSRQREASRLSRWLARPIVAATVLGYSTILFFAPALVARGSLTLWLPPAFGVLL